MQARASLVKELRDGALLGGGFEELYTHLTDLKEGDWVIQNAANSGVGNYLVQLAAMRGLKNWLSKFTQVLGSKTFSESESVIS